MKCDHCDKPAVVHEVVIKGGVTTEVHLCADHATQKGYQVSTVQMLAQFAGQFPAIAAAQVRKPGAQARCSSCGLPFAEFRQSGVLGCPACYEAFMPQIGGAIERAQAGAVHHVGRVPRRLEGLADRAAQRSRILQELEAAVAAEQYERAAGLRDRLKHLGGDGPS